MRRFTFRVGGLALAASLGVAPVAGAADLPVRLWLERTGRTAAGFGHKKKAPPAPPTPVTVTPPSVLPGGQLLPPGPVLTLDQFAKTFSPLPGNYEVVFLHPVTKCPVTVCFTLPPGCPKKVRASRRELEFDYGRYEVRIRFERRGGVKVDYDD